jgi:predicted phosphohydrolase
MKIAWTTDTHFDHTNQKARDLFLGEVIHSHADVLLITGDISGGRNSLLKWLGWLAENLPDVRLWFVLGNHDYYNALMEEVRGDVDAWISDMGFDLDWIHWFRMDGGIDRDSGTSIVGTDGWYDARFGNADGSVVLNDFFYIHDLRPFSKDLSLLLPKLKELADGETGILEAQVDKALQGGAQKVLVATHVPPFADAAWHEGSRSAVNFLPYFSCRSMGEMLVSKMEQHPDKEMLVLCGHTHGSGTFRPLPNLKVSTGGAVYGAPALCGIIEV